MDFGGRMKRVDRVDRLSKITCHRNIPRPTNGECFSCSLQKKTQNALRENKRSRGSCLISPPLYNLLSASLITFLVPLYLFFLKDSRSIGCLEANETTALAGASGGIGVKEERSGKCCRSRNWNRLVLNVRMTETISVTTVSRKQHKSRRSRLPSYLLARKTSGVDEHLKTASRIAWLD